MTSEQFHSVLRRKGRIDKNSENAKQLLPPQRFDSGGAAFLYGKKLICRISARMRPFRPCQTPGDLLRTRPGHKWNALLRHCVHLYDVAYVCGKGRRVGTCFDIATNNGRSASGR